MAEKNDWKVASADINMALMHKLAANFHQNAVSRSQGKSGKMKVEKT